MTSRNVFVAGVMLLAFLALSEGMSLGNLGVEQRCRCFILEDREITSFIEKKIDLFFPNAHCQATEIIATLKKDGTKICLNPEAPWLKSKIDNILSKQKNLERCLPRV